MTQIVPKNKTFLYIVFGLILMLLIYRCYPLIVTKGRKIDTDLSYRQVRQTLAHEMSIRQRHGELVKRLDAWNGHLLTGATKENQLRLLKTVEQWANGCGLPYESIQIPSDALGHKASLTMRGNAGYSSIMSFLQTVENASFIVTVSAIHLKNDASSGELYYDLTIEAPIVPAEGGRVDE